MKHFYTTYYKTLEAKDIRNLGSYKGTTLCGLKNVPWVTTGAKDYGFFLTREQLWQVQNYTKNICQACLNHPKVLLLLLKQL